MEADSALLEKIVKSVFVPLRRLLPLLDISYGAVGALVALGIFAGLSEGLSVSLLIPLFAADHLPPSNEFLLWLGSHFSGLSPSQRAVLASGGILAGIFIKNLLTYGYGVLFNWLNTGIGHRLRCAILNHALEADQEYLDRQDSSRFINTLGTETWRVASLLSVLADMLINACMVAIFAVLLVAISWQLALASLVFFLIVSAIMRLLTRKVRQLGQKAVAANSAFAHRMLEVFHGLREVKLFGQEDRERAAFSSASRGVRSTFFRMDSLTSLVHPVSEVLAAVFLIGVLLQSLSSRAEFGITVAFLVLLYRTQNRVKSLDSQRASLEALAGSVEEVADLLSASTGTPSTGRLRPSSVPEIRFEEVSLTYAGRETHALAGVSFLIPAGRSLALVGASGAGKTSVASLVCRIYDPTSGRVTVGGNDLRELDLAWWRERIAVVSQDVHLFNESIEYNILYGKPTATREEMVLAAKQALALEFIEALPEKFATRLGDRGQRLSGGQRQRIALARALIRDPDILILDEATNSLDLESERLVQDALNAFSRDKTVLIIAHRISSVEHVDHVIVLENGRLIEQGPPAQLAGNGGTYARLRALHYGSGGEVAGSEIPS